VLASHGLPFACLPAKTLNKNLRKQQSDKDRLIQGFAKIECSVFVIKMKLDEMNSLESD
jgi:hypothetical protein